MLKKVCREIVGALRDAGMDAREKYSGGDVRDVTGPVIFVGISDVKTCAAGLGHYIGTKLGEDMTQSELYGLRCEISLALDIYTSAKTGVCHSECAAAFDEALCAVAGIEGISVSEAGVGEGHVQAHSGLYMCPCRIKGQAYLVSEGGDGTEFMDFVLKGVLKNEH